MAAKITNFFERVDEPLPIRRTPSAEPPSKKPKHGPGRPRKVQPPTQRVIDSDSEQSDKENTDTGLVQAYDCTLWEPSFILDWHLFVGRTICTTQHWNVHEANFSRFDAKLEITVSEYSILKQN